MTAHARIQVIAMLKAVSEGIGRPPVKGRGPAGAVGSTAAPNMLAAATVKNVLFFLSLVFRYPREAVYAELGRLLPVFEEFFDAYAGNIPMLPEMEELQAEYIRLFVNNRGSVPVAPYASCHLDGGILMGECYHRLRLIMAKTGFVLDESAGELEDHLAILLEFASMLTGRLIDASVSGGASRDEVPDILGEVTFRYLGSMVKPIMDGISGGATIDFYAASVRALHNFLADAEAVYPQIFSVPVSAAIKTGVKK